MHVQTTTYGAPALAHLTGLVGRLKAEDPMQPVTVLVPSDLAGTAARRHLARGVGGRVGVAALEVTTVPRWAERLAASSLAPRRPATRPLVSAAVRSALASRTGVLADVADHPSTVAALAETHHELLELRASELDDLARAAAVTGEVVATHRVVRDQLAEHWYEPVDLLRAAAAALSADGPSHEVVLYLPHRLTRSETALLATVARWGRLSAVVALTGDARVDAHVHLLLDRLGGAADADDVPPPQAHRVLTASDADDEVRCVIRELVTTLRQTPPHRVAVLYTARVPYARLLHEHLDAARITVNGPGARPVQERAVARTLLELLALGPELPRSALFDALAHAPVRDLSGQRLPLTTWERVSRSAGVVRWPDWEMRLGLYAIDRYRDAESEDAEEWQATRAREQARTATRLQAFVADLHGAFVEAATMTTWRELADWALHLFTRLVGGPEELLRLPPEEQYAAATVTSTLRGLADFDVVEAPASLRALHDLLTLELSRARPRVGRFGEGVLVAPLSAAVGLDLDVVHVVGLSEDLYPGRQREDALLAAAARDRTAGVLPTLRDRTDERHRDLLAAFASADQVVASFARGDLRRSTHRLPSRWLQPTLRHLADDPTLSGTGWESARYGAAMTSSSSFAGELLSTPTLATEQEWRTRASAAGQFSDPVTVAATAMIQGRAGFLLTRFDGRLADVDGLPDYARDETAVSPTALESYVECPHAFFVGRLLGVEPVEHPEDVVAISPLDQGTLVHESLDELTRVFIDDLPGFGAPWTFEQRVRLGEITADRARYMEDRGLTGHPRLWQRDRMRIQAAIAEILAEDDRERGRTGARVVTSELTFGMRGRPPVEVVIPGGRVLMRGSADKVDQAPDGSLYVIDVKTGSDRTYRSITEADPLAGGTRLQLPVYGYAAREAHGDRATPVLASYWFALRGHRRVPVNLTPDVEARYAAVLDVLVRSIAAGLFPVRPPEKDDFAWVQCAYCNPDGVGYAAHRDRWQHKRTDPALAELLGLAEGGRR